VFAQPSLVKAQRLLLQTALKDCANSMFVLVSESCIPLYHPALFWAQLMAESHTSRMSDGMFGVHRWSPKMATGHFKPTHFRKGSQFSSLTRMHAQYVASDRHIWTRFLEYCKTQARPRCARLSSAAVLWKWSCAQAQSPSHPSSCRLSARP
jgi:Core-2/I-Branching enzyme